MLLLSALLFFYDKLNGRKAIASILWVISWSVPVGPLVHQEKYIALVLGVAHWFLSVSIITSRIHQYDFCLFLQVA